MGRIKEFASLTNLKNALMNVGEVNLHIIFRGKVYWIRTKEVWTPDLVEDSDEEELSDDDSLEEGMKNLVLGSPKWIRTKKLRSLEDTRQKSSSLVS
ncbi:hypothetical protein Tco_0020939 [Tanacetum coccineum]